MATEVSSEQEFQVSSVTDSLREEITQNLDENLSEHEVITETVFCNDSVKVERITDRVTVRERSAKTEAKKEEVRVVRDTVYVQKTDSVYVQKALGANPTENRRAPWLSALKWIFAIVVAVTVLVVIIKVSRFFRV